MSWEGCHACEKKRSRRGRSDERQDPQDRRRRDPKEERARSKERTRKRKAEARDPAEEEYIVEQGSLTLKGAKPKGKAAPKPASKPDPQPADAKTVKEWYAKYQVVPMEDWKKI